MAPGTFGPTALYEFTYIAQNPNIAGLGLAAIRDFATFLRDAKTDDYGTANPLAGDVKYIYTICSSQPCRTTRDFVLWGFNDADVPAGASQHMERSQLVEPVLAAPALSRKGRSTAC